jgi:hypothetical protein
MKKVAIALVASFTLGFGASAFARSPAAAEPTEASCKAAGQACSDKEDCCSRMCRKDTHKCA